MTDPAPDELPRRWPDDSPQEDAEVHRQRELARLEQWMAEQKTRPLSSALESHGLQPGNPGGQSWAGPVTTPDWWDQVPEPGNCCPWCQRPVPASPCPECRTAREQADDPRLWAWWASMPPAQRRLYLAARWGRDPWTGRPVQICAEWTNVAEDSAILTTRPPFLPIVPATAWNLGVRQV